MGKRRSVKKKSSSTNDREVVEKPGPTDVLFGRGGHVNHNPANQRYLELVSERKEEYHNCKKTDKASIAWDIMRELRERNPLMRFLRKDYNTNLWHVVEDADVRRKISQCLRERGVPVCPTAKGKKMATTTQTKNTLEDAKTTTSTRPSTTSTKLRLSLRTSGKKAQAKGASDEDEWLPEEEEEFYVPRVTTRSSSAASRRSEDGMASFKEARRSQENSSCYSAQAQKGTAEAPLPPSFKQDYVPSSQVVASTATQQPPNQELPRLMEVDVPVAVHSNTEAHFVPPPMPARMPLKQEGSNRVWSDFFTRSFASFAPSIFDFTGNNPENTWENLLDPSILPELTTSEDEESFPGTHDAPTNIPIPGKRCYSQSSRSYSQVSISNPLGWVECISPGKRRKIQPDESDVTDPLSFLDDVGQVPEQSLSLSTTTSIAGFC